jgi:hypothetical protein
VGIVDSIIYWTSLTSAFSVSVRFSLATLGGVLLASSVWMPDDRTRWWCRWGGLGLVMVALVTLSIVCALFLIADVEHDRFRREGWQRMLGIGEDGDVSTGEW